MAGGSSVEPDFSTPDRVNPFTTRVSQGVQGLGMEPVVDVTPGGVSYPGFTNTMGQIAGLSSDYYTNYWQGMKENIDSQGRSVDRDMLLRSSFDWAKDLDPVDVNANSPMTTRPIRDAYLKSDTSNPNTDGNTGERFENNPFDFSTLNIGAEDIGSRFLRLGNTIGRARSEGYDELSGGAKAANVISGVTAGLSGLAGIARNLMTGISGTIGASKDAQLAQQREYRQRRDSQMRQAEGGGTYLGPGNRFSAKSLAGEYAYPLPKSMQGNANVEVEKGEYVIRPGDTPKEALGETHEKGGTPMALETGTRVISDDTKITADFAKKLRDDYGIKATPKDTYATIVDRYKKKIGLKAAYDDQRSALDRMEKNDKVEDENTRVLNQSVLSKAISEVDERISGLEKRLTDFTDIVYAEQENQKNIEIESTYMAKGGEVDKALNEAQRKYGFSDEEMREIRARMIAGIKERQFMEEGNKVVNPLGRQLRFRRVANPNAKDSYGHQSLLNTGYYGTTNDDWTRAIIGIMPRLGSYEDALKMGRIPFARRIEDVFQGMNTGWNTAADLGLVSNADELRNYINENKFLSDNSVRGTEGKLGEYHLSRPNISLDAVNYDQWERLKDEGITYYSQLFTDDNKAKAQEILGDDYAKLQALGEIEGMSGIDFMLDPYMETLDPIENPGINPPDVDIDLNPITPEAHGSKFPAYQAWSSGQKEPDKRRDPGQAAPMGSGLYFPMVHRLAPSNVVSEGLERYRAPHVDPVLQSADQYMTEMSRTFQSQLDQLGQVPDSQRGAMMSNLMAIMGSSTGNYINQVEQANNAARTDARNKNAVYWKSADDQNIAERLRYQAGYLKGQAINEENWARYYDNVNQEQQQKWNARTSMNTLRSIFGDVEYLPDGRVVVNPKGNIVDMPSWMRGYGDTETTTYTTTDSKGNTRRTTKTKTTHS